MKSIPKHHLLVCSVLAAAISSAGTSLGQLVNLNFNGGADAPVESTLSGPAGGLGTSWNSVSTVDAGPLVDSTGAATTISIDTNYSNISLGPDLDGTLPVFRSFLNIFDRPNNNTVTITGLEPEGVYNIWLLSYRNFSDPNFTTERNVGTWSTTNTTTSPSSQAINSQTIGTNGTAFVEGYNYVLFGNVEATAGGVITFTAQGQGFGLPQSSNSRRAHLSGLQIEKTTPPVIGVVDDSMSTVNASPATVFADGVLTSTVTVTLKDSDGDPVPGKDVTLANTAGPQDAVIVPMTAVTTNTAGQATFSVSSSSPGIEVFTATDVTDSLTLTDTASVEFIEVGVLTDAAQSTVTASPPSVLAGGSSTITVTLRDANGYPVSGNQVTLANTGGAQTAVITPPGALVSNASGQAVFSVSTSTPGIEEFTATDTTDSVVVTQIATSNFIDPSTPRLINVNFTGNQNPPPSQTGLVGPAGGLVTSWNQFLGPDSPGTLVDFVGAATTVTIDTNFGLPATLDTPVIDLTMLRGSATNFGKGVDNTNVTINGLVAGGYYDIWLVTLRNQPFGSDGTEQYVGWWSTTNSTTSPSDQLVDARGVTINTTTFVEGYNYVLFENVEADETGKVVFTGVAGPLLDGSNNNHRLGLNGLQIRETDPPLAQILTFGIPGAAGVINESAKTISLSVPYGTDLATVAPTFTLTSGNCNQTSGSPPSPSFATSNPVQYTVTDSSTDPDTVSTYTVTLSGSLVIDLGTSPAGTTIAGGSFIGTGPTNLPLPTLPSGSILRSIAANAKLETTDNGNWASDLSVLLDPTPGSPGGDFSVEITNGETPLAGAALDLNWPGSANNGPGTLLVDTKTAADWAAAAPIDLATTGLFLGNAYGGPSTGGTWSGTIALTYDLPGSGSPYDTWKSQITNGLDQRTDDADGDGFNNLEEFLFGTSPIAGNGSLVTTTASGGNLVLRWLQREGGATYTLKQSPTLGTGSWTTVVSPVPAPDGDQTGAPTDYDYYTVTLPTGSGKLFFRIEGVEN